MWSDYLNSSGIQCSEVSPHEPDVVFGKQMIMAVALFACETRKT